MATTWAWATAFKRMLPLCALMAVTFTATAANQPTWVQHFLQRWSADPQPRYLWLLPPLKQKVARILGHPYPKVRLPWWQASNRTLWVLEEIGKEQPITVGVVVEQGRIIAVEVLKFRESRGGEVQLPAFRRQFEGAHLTPTGQLDQTIDGISGATLSVRAVKKLARMALLLDNHIRTNQTQ